MQGSGREFYAETSDQLTAATAKATAAQLATVADEVLSVAGLLRGEPRLRRALTDPSRPGAERAELIRSLLSGKVSDPSTDAMGTLAGGRWSRPGDLLDATERLGVDTVLRSAEKSRKLADVEDELFRFGQIVAGNPSLAITLADSSTTVDRRAELVRDLVGSKVHATTLRLIQVALAGFGGRSFDASLARLVELTAARRDREVAYVTVARPLDTASEERLSAKLADIYGRQVSLKVDVDPRVIGGVSVRVGSDLYDGTILRRLTEAKQTFAK